MSFELDTSGAVLIPRENPKSGFGTTEQPLRIVRWSDLDPFTQGYVRAALESLIEVFQSSPPDESGRWERWGYNVAGLASGGGYATEAEARAAAAKHVRFDKLAPATLAAMMKDCASNHEGALYRGYSSTGFMFWARRQRGCLPAFPPLTLSLGDDGLIYASEAGR